MSDTFQDVGEFHERFGLDNVNYNGPGPRALNRELMQFRLNFLLEELKEFMEAVGAEFALKPHTGELVIQTTDDSDIVDDPAAFDALLDLVYVAHGTAHLMGYPWQEGWDAVQTANMAKVRAQSADESKRGSSFDVVKPKGWMAPDIAAVLEKNGWSF